MGMNPGAPRVTRGAVVALDPKNPLASVIVFQYNPEKLTRTLSPGGGENGTGENSEPYRVSGAPREDIDITVEIDATDQLEKGEGRTGIHPQLAALEMLLYPKSAHVLGNVAKALRGTVEIVPPESPMTLFIWGVRRVLPVKIGNISIREVQHDTRLNPIQAEVDLKMKVVSYSDLTPRHPGFHLFIAHQAVKETMATLASVNGL